MKVIRIVSCTIALCTAATLFAQTSETRGKSKVSVKNGQDVSVTGCVVETPVGDTGFMLTHVADKTGALHNYVLVSDEGTLAKHVGHRVEVKGTATDRGGAKVEIESRTKTEHGDGETRTKSEVQGDQPEMPYLGVKSLKMIAAVCP